MFYSKYKKAAIAEYEAAMYQYNDVCMSVVDSTAELNKKRSTAVDILNQVDSYIQKLSQIPAYIESTMSEINVRTYEYTDEFKNLLKDSSFTDKLEKSGITMVGTNAIEAIRTLAMTFGKEALTVSVPVQTIASVAVGNMEIATVLSGSAAAAGSGSGSYAAADSGSACGKRTANGKRIVSTVLPFLLHPRLLSTEISMLVTSSVSNISVAKNAEWQARDIKEETKDMKCLGEKIKAEIKAVEPLNDGVKRILNSMLDMNAWNYKEFTTEQKQMLMQLMNSSESLSKRIGVKIS